MEMDSGEEPTAVEIIVEDAPVDMRERLEEALFKIRSHMDDTGGEYSLGFESGLEMAAQIIENVLKSGETSGS